jgi:two-component system LytT family sensor kinase
VTPVVIYVSDRFPVRRPHRARNSAVMAVVIILVAAMQALVSGWLPVLLEGLPMKTAGYRESVLYVFHNYLLIAVLLVGGANLLRIEREDAARRRMESRLRAELAEARLRQLRASLQPHFLFNTLNALAALLHRDPAAAEQALLALRDLLRASLALEATHEAPLASELEFLRRYLDIQKMRYGSKLAAEIHVSDGRLERAAVPPLLLQPLVENSIVHGIAKRRHGGRVVVEVDAAGDWLCLRVRDDGGGSGPVEMPRPGSVGVPNARARLESLYGERQSLTYTRRGVELIAEVRIPLRIIGEAA